VNISIRPKGQKEFGTKCELKNLNTISGVRRSLHSEIARQIEVVSNGGEIRQETRRWDDAKGQTFLMRIKEKAHDYRYFPDPDLLPLRTDHGLRAEAETRVPELPQAKIKRLQSEYGVTEYQAGVLASEIAFANYFESAAKPAKNKILIANFLLNDYLATGPDITAIPIPPSHFTELSDLIDSAKINSKQAKEVFSEMIASNKAPTVIVKEKGLEQVTDMGALEQWCDEAIAANEKGVADYKSGKLGAINSIKGYVMKMSKGKANPSVIDEILIKKLTS
jgi:aspartyl-tRNA(Asn)/glutamyl-tRNA(Gln) amidotransferase subunit B